MRKTLLLVFLHGFKGGDDTFEKFPEHLRVLIADILPKINVLSVVYPRYETRGELNDCVARFKEWLQNKIIDLEVAAGTPSPTIDPSVRVILVGHSMGGIVAAETLLSIARDEPVPSDRTTTSTRPGANRTNSSTAHNATSTASTKPHLSVPKQEERSSSAPPSANDKTNRPPPTSKTRPSDPDGAPTFLFPFIQGILAFDTPYLGIHPGVVAHGAESHYQTASAAMNAYNSASKFFGGGGAKSTAPAFDAGKALPPAGAANNTGGGWGKYALFAGGAAALAAGAAGAYYGREKLSTGWNWVYGHLAFVGCLARGAELAARVEEVVKLSERYGIGFVDFYTKLGPKEGATNVAGQLLGEERTFCVVPKEAKKGSKGEEKEGKRGREERGESPAKKRKVQAGTETEEVPSRKSMKGNWVEAVNTKSEDEITAHRAMFTPKDYPGYYKMSEKASHLVAGWVDRGWYEASDGDEEQEGGQEEGK
ncbi:hypothetical protein B9Z65_6814 [Elsinoe australis]|uniref:DUF676 domain-containing protein n=1 Tax=Elsinoe australis TaxID=40998 RepID=A0A2P7Z3R7_9PEZI|nr:hypothetical protein B9Z65_6814 [Elsinoe australis]